MRAPAARAPLAARRRVAIRRSHTADRSGLSPCGSVQSAGLTHPSGYHPGPCFLLRRCKPGTGKQHRRDRPACMRLPGPRGRLPSRRTRSPSFPLQAAARIRYHAAYGPGAGLLVMSVRVIPIRSGRPRVPRISSPSRPPERRTCRLAHPPGRCTPGAGSRQNRDQRSLPSAPPRPRSRTAPRRSWKSAPPLDNGPFIQAANARPGGG